MSFTCPLCMKISPSAKGMGNHFTRFHGLKTEQLAHHFHMPTRCACGLAGKFLSLTRGFASHCPSCETRVRSESVKNMHRRIKSDPIRYEQFCKRTSEAMLKQWAQDQSGRLENMGPKAKHLVHSDEANAFIELMGSAPWTEDQLSQIFEVA